MPRPQLRSKLVYLPMQAIHRSLRFDLFETLCMARVRVAARVSCYTLGDLVSETFGIYGTYLEAIPCTVLFLNIVCPIN